MFPPLLLLAAVEPAPPPIRLPAEVAARPGRLVRLEADTPAPHVRWLVVGDADLVPLPGTKSAVLVGPAPGQLLVFAWTAAGDVPSEAARCVVRVGDPAPPPDALAADLRAAFAADPSPQKAAHARQLTSAYRQAAAAAGSARTAGEVYAALRHAVSLPADALVGVRRRLGEEANKALAFDPDAALDAKSRAACVQFFTRLAGLLEGLK